MNYTKELEDYPFNMNFNELIIKLSKLFAITNVDPFKNAKNNNNAGTEHFIRSTSKYWVHKSIYNLMFKYIYFYYNYLSLYMKC